MRLIVCLAALLPSAVDPKPAPTADAIAVAVPNRKEPVSYAKEIADFLAAKCVGCHSSALAENKLNIEEVAGMLKGGKRGPAIVPGKAEESLLFKMAAHRVEPFMPPKGKKDQKPLTPAELGLFKLWIDAGAKDDSEENAEESKPIELGELPPGVQPIGAVDLTTDGKRIAAGRANVVHVYDADSGLEIVALGGHKDIIQSIRFSPDGTRLAAGSYQFVTLWTVPTGRLAQTFTGHGGPVRALALAADGKTAFSGGSDKTIRVWETTSNKLLRKIGLPAEILALALSPDGRTVAVGGSDHIVRVLNTADGKEICALKGHTKPVLDLTFFPDGKRLVSVAGDGTVRIWPLPFSATEKPAEPIVLNGHKGPVHSVAITPDSQGIVTGGDDGVVQLWHAADGKPSRRFEGHTGPVLALSVSPRGDALLTGCSDKKARLFDLSSGALRHVLKGQRAAVQAVAFGPNGTRLVTGGADGGLKIWETANGQGVIAFGHTALGTPAQPVHKVAFASEGSLVSASADKTLRSWTFEGKWSELKPLGPHVFRVLAIDFNPDGTLIATGGGEPSRSGEVLLWEAGKGLLVRKLDTLHSDTVFGLRFSPDGTKLASASADKFLKVTNVADGKQLRSFEGHTHHVLAVDWKSDGKQLVTGGADNVLKLWDYESGEQVRTLQAAGKQVTSVQWVPGKPRVAGASGDKLVRFWNPDSGGITRSFEGPSDYVYGVAISRDGSRVVAGGADSVLFLWSGADGKVLRKIEPPALATTERTALARP